MKQPIRYLTILMFAFSFLSMRIYTKDLTEYGKWLKYYNLEHEDFQKVGNDTKRKIIWSDYNLNEEYIKFYKPYYIYSPDSTYFIDLDSYSLSIENENGKLISYGSGIDMKVEVVRQSDFKSTTLLFCGSSCIPETANWITDSWIEILGFSVNETGGMIPTKWKVNLDNMIFSDYQIDTTFNSISNFYYEKERLKMIEFIKK